MVSLLKKIFRRKVVVEFKPWEFFSEDGGVYFNGTLLLVDGKEIGHVGHDPVSAVHSVLTELGYSIEIKQSYEQHSI
jgi:hypothetical protein